MCCRLVAIFRRFPRELLTTSGPGAKGSTEGRCPMYQVFLVDDEALIVEGLKKVVDWEKYGCTVCGTATDGKTGLEEIRRRKPDILFTDICMPEMDGLAMIAALKSEFPDLQIAILTGYHDFSYAQQAIRLGVTRLLTKPSRMDEIQEAIEAMIGNLRAAEQRPESPAEAEDGDGSGAGSGSFVVRLALGYMDANYAEKLILQDVADHCYVSQWHLSKLLNKHTGKSFYELLNAVRIREAKRLLKDPKLRISDISEQVGYTDPGHFCRTFKKLAGVSANEYRNNLED